MPQGFRKMTYEYLCSDCQHAWEEEQSISAPATEKCPNCGKLSAQRQVSGGVGFILKGGGWYADGYGSGSSKKSEDASSGSGGGSKPADSKSSGTADATKPGATKTDTSTDTSTGGDSKPSGTKSGDSPASPPA
jgi:putative FmdB family regulatory protein